MRREGRGWLDPHRYSIQAPMLPIARVLRSAAVAFFARSCVTSPRPGAMVEDGTAAADAKTRLWLESEGLLGQDATPAQPPPAAWSSEPAPPVTSPAAPAGEGKIEVTAEAAALADSGRGADAGYLASNGPWPRASSGRDRFLLELHLAEMCLRLGSEQVALAFLEDLERQVDGFRLEEWEHRERMRVSLRRFFNVSKTAGRKSGSSKSTPDFASSTCVARCKVAREPARAE